MHRGNSARWTPLYLTLLLASLAGCGGGGGGSTRAPEQTPTSSTHGTGQFTVSGVFSVPDSSAIDSEIDDGSASVPASNDTLATAQRVNSPLHLIGTLNMPDKGARRPSRHSGDIHDIFRVDLLEGQVVRLDATMDLSNDAPEPDVDLALIDAETQQIVGASNRLPDSVRDTECVRITKSGPYFIDAYITQGAGNYVLSIARAEDDIPCRNAASASALFAAGELVSQRKAPGNAAIKGTWVTPAPELLKVPGAVLSQGASVGKPEAQASVKAGESGNDTYPQQINTLIYAKQLQASGQYAYVEPNFRVHLHDAPSAYEPDDPKYTTQRWHYEQINLPSALERIKGLPAQPTRRPLVAVIDTGIYSAHPDLAGQVEGGFTFTSVAADGDKSYPGAEEDTYRASFHGTHVAGTIAALNDNAKYGAGVAPMAKLMPLRVFPSAHAFGTTFDILQAIRYAAGLGNVSGKTPARKADVINMSLGEDAECHQQVQDTITQARAQNVIIVASAGNSGLNHLGLVAATGSPANCAGVLGVGALDADRKLTQYSSSGSALALVAPGGDGTVEVQSLAVTSSGTGFSPDFGGKSGTSMASPHVAGVMALMRYVNPAITPQQIDDLLAMGRLTQDLGVAGRDDRYGFGEIDARKAVDEALALVGDSTTLAQGVVTARPASLDLGSFHNTIRLDLANSVASGESVVSLTTNSPAIQLLAGDNVDARTQLGSYTLTVDRTSLPIGRSHLSLNVTTSLGHGLVVPVNVTKLATTNGKLGNYGLLHITLTSNNGPTNLWQCIAPVDGKYSWKFTGVPGGEINVIAITRLGWDINGCQMGTGMSFGASMGNVGAVLPDIVSRDRDDYDAWLFPTPVY